MYQSSGKHGQMICGNALSPTLVNINAISDALRIQKAGKQIDDIRPAHKL